MENYRRFAVLIGNSEFPDDKEQLPTLNCPLNDVDGLDKVLASSEHGMFETKVLPNKPSYEVRKTIDGVLKKADKNDLVLIYYSGHGKPSPISGQLYLATYDTDCALLDSTSMPVRSIKEMIENSSVQKIVVMLDCCYSGAAIKAFLERGGSINDQLTAQLPTGHGRFIMTASTDIQTAKEKPGDQYGLFTKHLIDGLREAPSDSDGWVTTDELYKYVDRKFSQESGQTPLKSDLVQGSGLRIAKSGKPTRKERYERLKKLLTNLHDSKELPESVLHQALIVAQSRDPSSVLVEQNKLLDKLDKKEITTLEFLVQWVDLESTKLPPQPEKPAENPEQPASLVIPEEPEEVRKMAVAAIALADHLVEEGKRREARAKYTFVLHLLQSLPFGEQVETRDLTFDVDSKILLLDKNIANSKGDNTEYLASQIETCEKLLESGEYYEAESTFRTTINQLAKEVSVIDLPPTLFPLLDKLASKAVEKNEDKEYDKAIEYLEFRLELPEEKKESSIDGRTRALQLLGTAMLRKGDYASIDDNLEMAAHLYKLSLEFFEWLEDNQNLATTYARLGELAEKQNSLEDRASYLQKSEEHAKRSTPPKKHWPLFAVKVVQAGFVVQEGELVNDKVRFTFQNVGKLTWRKGRKMRVTAQWTLHLSLDPSILCECDRDIQPGHTCVSEPSKEFPSSLGRHRTRIKACLERSPWDKSDDKPVCSAQEIENLENQQWRLVEQLPPNVQASSKTSFRIDLYTRTDAKGEHRGQIECLHTKEKKILHGIDKEVIAGFISAHLPTQAEDESIAQNAMQPTS